MEAADTLENLVWGSHRAIVEVYQGRNRALNISGSLSNKKEKQVLGFHRKQVAWTGNAIHMPTFAEERERHRHTEYSLPTVGWLLYYAVHSACSLLPCQKSKSLLTGLVSYPLCICLRSVPIGLDYLKYHLLAQSFYDLAIESPHAAELATVNSSKVDVAPDS